MTTVIVWGRLLLCLLILAVFCVNAMADAAHAGEGRLHNLGITVDSANHNADVVRRSQNRKTRDINRVNEW